MDRDGDADVAARSGAGPRRAVVVVLAALLLALLVLASAAGPVGFVDAPVSGASPTSVVTPTLATSTAVTPSSDASGDALPPDIQPLPPIVVTLIKAVLLLVVLAGAALGLRWLWRTAPRWRSRVVATATVETLPEPVIEELTETADARMDLLHTGTPRHAIITCWLDLEDSAAAVGLPRDPAETSAEYTRRVLATWEVAPRALSRLAALYREARFSRHELGEEVRADAVTQLATLHTDLRRVAGRLADEKAAAAARAELLTSGPREGS